MSLEGSEDTAHSAVVTDHAFEPDGEWWGLCKHCHLAESTHQSTKSPGLPDPPNYRCPECVSIRDMGGEMPHKAGECPRLEMKDARPDEC